MLKFYRGNVEIIRSGGYTIILNSYLSMKLEKKTFPSPKGEISWVTITNDHGMEVTLSSVGAGIVSVKIPQAAGKKLDVVLGYDNPEAYFADGPCAGKTPGRFANRIADGKITVNGKLYQLPVNNGPNHLHGGPDGFQNQVWHTVTEGDNKVVFTLESPDGDAGYPGNLKVMAVYTVGNDNSIQIDYFATTDAPTVVNLTNHTYFNLDGHDAGSCLGQTLQLNCSKMLAINDVQIPTGELLEVAGTPFDFTTPHKIGERIADDNHSLRVCRGYDHCWMVDGFDGSLRTLGTLKAAQSERSVTIKTDQPGAQVYTGNWLDDSPVGKGGYKYHDYDAVAIECQGAPDAPNHPNLPSQQLNPGEEYRRRIRFEFSF